MPSRLAFFFAVVLVGGCAGPKPASSVEAGLAPRPAPAPSGSEHWSPRPGAEAALAALWKAEPFALPAADLARASGGALPGYFGAEVLLSEEFVRYDAEGRCTRTHRTVYRILTDAAELKTEQVTWAAWHQERPTVKTRVVSAEGDERWLDPKTIVEGSAASSPQFLTDARVLEAPLPGARIGAVVEREVTLKDKEPAFPAAASGRFETWSFERTRRVRLTLEHPTSLPLVPIVIGGGALAEFTSGGIRTLRLDMAPPEFNGFKLAREDVPRLQPRVEWSTSRSWNTVARAYNQWIDEARAEGLDTLEIQRIAGSAPTRMEKIQRSLNWLRERARYSALQLGVGAFKPTPPRTVLERGYGDCKDLAVALTVILESVGVPAQPALIQSEGIPTAEAAPGITGFDHMIVYVPAQGSEPATWVDATDPFSPAGVLTTQLLDRRALVLASDTQGLTALPTRAQTTSTILERVTIDQAEFGWGKVTLSRQFEGPAAGAIRAEFAQAEDKELERFFRETDSRLLGKDKLAIDFEHRGPGSTPPRLVATVESAKGVETSAAELALILEGPYLDYWIAKRLLGTDLAKKETNSERLKKDDAEALEATGLTAAELDRRPVHLPSQLVLERKVKVIPAWGFVASELPPARTVAMGPARWSEQFATLADGSVEATYRFETGAVDFEPEALATFRSAFWNFNKESWPRLTLKLAPQLLFDRSKPQEAMAAWRKALAERPTDAALRARYAETLSDFGLNELARPEIDRAFKDGPRNPLVLMIKGDLARRDPQGVVYRPPFDRAGAIEAFRAASALVPDHTWPRIQLAELLERNPEGDIVWEAGKDLEESAALFAQLVADHSLDTAATQLLDIDFRLGRYAQILELKRARGQALTSDVYGLCAGIFINGPEDARQYLRAIADQKKRVAATAQLLGVLAVTRDYRVVDAAAALFEEELPGGPGGILRGLFGGLKAWPVGRDFSTPEAAMRSALSTFTVNPAKGARLAALKALATPAGKKELDELGFSLWGAWASNAGAPPADALLSRGKCEIDGDPAIAVRVRCAANLGQPLAAVGYWVRTNGAFKLDSVGWLQTLSDNAWAAASGGKGTAARLWLNWYAEALDKISGGKTQANLSLFKASWPVRGEPTPEQLRFAASQACALSDSQKMPAAAVKQLDQARLQLTGSKRRLADETLATVYQRRKDPARAISLLKPLAESEGEERLFRMLTHSYARLGQISQARALTQSALARTPSDLAWVEVAATVAARDEKYPEAVGLLQTAYDRTGDRSLVNDLAWYRMMAGVLDDDTEKLANGLVANDSSSRSELHTAAVVLLARGRVDAAAQLAHRIAFVNPVEPWDDAQLQLRAQLLQVLGFPQEAKLAWGKMKDPEGDMLRLRQRGLKQLEAKRP